VDRQCGQVRNVPIQKSDKFSLVHFDFPIRQMPSESAL
jgi:hypothetical protein